MATQPDSRQVKHRQQLTRLGTAAQATLDTILGKANTEFDSPLRMSASATPDAILNFSSSSIAAADVANKVVPAVKKQIFNGLTNPTINFQTQALSNAAHFDISFPVSTVGQFRHVGFTLIGSGKIKALFSAEAASEGALSNPGALFVSGGLPIGYITLECTQASPSAFKTAGSATNIVENAKIFRFGSGGGAGSSSSGSGAGGGELVDLLFQAAIRDSFADIPDGTTTVDVAAGKTDATLHDVANELFRLSYDASLTVTGTGTSMTLSGTPAFTIKAGDMLIVNGEARKITATPTQTTPTIESAFSADPSAAACCVSQAVHTVDLNAFDNAGLGLAASSQFTGDIDEILVGYSDSDTSGDIIPDFGTTADVAFSASADDSSWSDAKTRPDSLSDEVAALSTPTASTQLKLRFFANKTSGTGAVNLLSFKVFFHKQTGETAGTELLSAFARPTSSVFQNCTHGVVGGKSRFQLTWAYPRGLNNGEPSGSALQVYANGQRIPRFASGVTDSAQAYFTEISENIVEMDTDYSSAGIDFQFRYETTIIDSNTQNTTRLTEAEAILTQAIDAQIVPTFLSAINGTPSASQFRSDITNRAQIMNLGANLSVNLGVERTAISQIARVLNEYGPTGQSVYKPVNDRFNQIRFVGTEWFTPFNTVSTGSAYSATINDYVEVVFYGTGLNILTRLASTMDVRVSIDGGAEGANIFAGSYSTILDGRSYNPNQMVSIASGLTLGVHTAKIRINSSATFYVFGFEFLNQATQLTVCGGTAVKGKYENSLALLSNINYASDFESGVLGTRGGSVVVYLKSDGTIGKAVTPANASQANLTSADHSNEEVVRNYNFREFGANRADDFSTLVTSIGDRAFTLDDGTTTLVGQSTRVTGVSGAEITANGGSSSLIFTFVGTGFDIIKKDSSNATASDAVLSFSVDGTSIGSTAALADSTSENVIKVVSGLPYGTHTVRIIKASGVNYSPGFSGFIVYQPKKPVIPADAIELARYNLMANFVANTTAGTNPSMTISTGVLRKVNVREFAYVGTFSLGSNTNFPSGFGEASTQGNGNYIEYTFFGTGFDHRFIEQTARAATINVTLNGLTLNTTNFPTALTSNTGNGVSMNLSTGVMDMQASVNGALGGISVYNLPLDKYTLRLTKGDANATVLESTLDIVTPIHNFSTNTPASLFSNMNVGNDSIGDLRKWNSKDIAIQNQPVVAIAQGITSSPSTTSTSFVLMPEMSTVVYSKGARYSVDFNTTLRNSTAGNSCRVSLFVNGVQLPETEVLIQPSTANFDNAASFSHSIYLPEGFHKVDVYWRTSAGTMTNSSLRLLTIKELKNT